MFARLRHVTGLPREERNAKLKRAIRNRAQLLLKGIVFSTIGYWMNLWNRTFVIGCRPDFHADFDRIRDYPELIKGWIYNNRINNAGDLARFYTIYLNVNQVLEDRVPGDFVELGVYKGNSAKLLASLGRRQNRHLYLFDTFTGFDSRDLRGMDSGTRNDFADTSLKTVQKLVGTEGVTYVPGFFPDSTSQIEMPERIAIAHIDCDLYEPMKAGLEWFYPRLSTGGILLLHDYSSGYWPGAKRAIDEFFEKRPEKPVLAADKSGTALIRRLGSA